MPEEAPRGAGRPLTAAQPEEHNRGGGQWSDIEYGDIELRPRSEKAFK